MARKQTSQETVRRRLLKIVDRSILEEISGMERAWTVDRKVLEEEALKIWSDSTFEEILWFVKKAK